MAILDTFSFLHHTLLTAKEETKITSADQIISTDKADLEELTKAIRQLRIAYYSANEPLKKKDTSEKEN